MKKTVKMTLSVVAGLVALVAVVLVVGFMPGDTTQMKQIANQFKPDPSWKLESESIQPARVICFDSHCDEMTKVWKTPGEVSLIDIRAFLERSKFDVSIVGTCSADEGSKGTGSSVCSASGEIDAYKVEVYLISSADKPANSSVHLFIKG